MKQHLREKNLEQLDQIGTILAEGWTRRDTGGEQQPPPTTQQTVATPTPKMTLPMKPPIPPPRRTRKVQVALPQKIGFGLPVPCKLSNLYLLFQPPNPASLATPVIIPTITIPYILSWLYSN